MLTHQWFVGFVRIIESRIENSGNERIGKKPCTLAPNPSVCLPSGSSICRSMMSKLA